MRLIKFMLLTCVFIALGISSQAQTRKERMERFSSENNYEIQCIGVGNDGTKSVKVWSYAKSVKKALYKIKIDAIAAAIFRGIPAGGGAAATPAIISEADAYDKYAEFFDTFFEAGGQYLLYVNLSNEGVPVGQNKIKMKGGYKVGIIVSIDYNALRSFLEQKGVAKRLDSGF